MMQSMFEVTVRYSKAVEGTDKQKRVNEVYLFDALTYTEAEKLAYERLPELLGNDFVVAGIRKAHYAEVIPCDEGGYWFKVKTSFILVDENSGKEKRVTQTVLTLALDIVDAISRTNEAIGGTPDFMVKAVQESNIFDFFPYFSKDDDVPPAEREISRRPATEEELAAARAKHDEQA